MCGIGRSGSGRTAYRREVVDRALRPVKSRLLAPLTAALGPVPADAVTLAGVVVGLAAALSAAFGRFDLALGAWWLNRLLDGLDGELARARAAAAPTRGAYLDLMADLLTYATLPLGLAAGVAGTLTGAPLAEPAAVWLAAGAVLAAFYLNLGSWSLLSAALLRLDGATPAPAAAARSAAGSTSEARLDVEPGLPIPAGLMEGAETIVAFSLALLWPAAAVATLSTIALLTLLTAAQRTWWGARRLAGAGPR